MIIFRENNEYVAFEKLPDGSIVKGSGETAYKAILWALWGVKSYFNRLKRA